MIVNPDRTSVEQHPYPVTTEIFLPPTLYLPSTTYLLLVRVLFPCRFSLEILHKGELEP